MVNFNVTTRTVVRRENRAKSDFRENDPKMVTFSGTGTHRHHIIAQES